MTAPRRSRLAVLAAASGAALALGFAGPAAAHVHADPAALQHGATGEIAFGIEHGCEESPTVAMELRFPDEFTDLKPVAKEGWTTAVSGQVVSFTGGSVPHDDAAEFAVEVTAPEDAGTYHVPVVQTCEEGVLRWIEIAEEGAPEPESPAVAVLVTEGAPTAADLAHGEEAESGAAAEGEGHGEAEGEAHGGEAEKVTPPTIVNVDGNSTGYVVAGVAGALMVVALGAVIANDRKRDADFVPAHH